ncbi:MAG: bifunctional phosphopantothenoylcysteine decarboxylase/phosphopantothenate--cysteine ligase CoaBC [Pseudomonadota bacterium]
MTTITLVVSGGIAAYKAPELIRQLGQKSVHVIPVMTQAAKNFVTPLVLSSIANNKVYSDLFDLTDEQEMGHIALSRAGDCIIVAPCSANLIAKMANGFADDLASTLLLAATCPIVIAPAMNMHMWLHDAVQHNVATLAKRGIKIIPPDTGEMACGDFGPGRLPDPHVIIDHIMACLENATVASSHKTALRGKSAIVTAGPTFEPIDPVRFIANRSSGKQGYAIAHALAKAGCAVTLVSGPTALTPPSGVHCVSLETAAEMFAAVHENLPCDIAVCAAAVADWRCKDIAPQKQKKTKANTPPIWSLEATPDILASLAASENRPKITVGFAAETKNLRAAATAKRKAKGCDWLLANMIDPQHNVFGSDDNTILFVDARGNTYDWPSMPKSVVADKLVMQLEQYFSEN